VALHDDHDVHDDNSLEAQYARFCGRGDLIHDRSEWAAVRGMSMLSAF